MDKLKKIGGVLGLAVLLAIITALGIANPQPAEPEPTPVVMDSQGVRYGQYGNARFQGSIIVENDATITDDLTVTDDVDVNGDLDVDGTLNADAIDIDGAIDMGDQALTSVGAAEFDSTLNVDGAVTLNSTLDVDGSISSGTGAVTVTDAVNITSTLDVDSTLNVDAAATVDSLDVDNGSITLQNDETIGNATDGYISFGGGVLFNSTSITVTDGQTITPTVYTAYRLNAAGAVTITLAACSQDFQPLALYGEDNVTITIADSNVRTNDGGVQALGQYDHILWFCINSEWVEVSESNNS